MSEQIDLSFGSLSGISAAIRAGRLSPVTLTEHCITRIESLNPTFNAFITVTADLAREQALEAEKEIHAGRWRGSLHGIPVAVKDFYDTAGIRTTAAFEHFLKRVPSRDADMVRSLRETGAVLVGKTNMHTLGKGTTSLESAFGPVVNPWSASHVAGGSSGGSAAALAAGLCFATIDTDAVGSGRLPAAICGNACLKPTFGLLSTEGILAGEPAEPEILALSHPSVMARSAEDVALTLGALIKVAPGDASAGRIGIVTNFSGSEDVKAAFANDVARIKALQVETLEVEVPFEAASFDVRHIKAGRARINAKLFTSVDALVLPTLVAPTPTVEAARAAGDMAVSADNTFFCNYFGLPAITVPSGVDQSGLPRGVQIVGPQGADLRVLALAHALQKLPGRPPMFR